MVVTNNDQNEATAAIPGVSQSGNGVEGVAGVGVYATLSDAIASNTTNAAVEVFRGENGRQCVMLLQDVAVEERLTIAHDMDLVLNGHTLSLTTSDACISFAEGTVCVVNGEAGGAVVKENIATTEGQTVIFEANGEKLTLLGGSYTLSGNLYEGRVLLSTGTSGTVELIGAKLRLENARAEASVTNQNIVFEANGARACMEESSIEAQCVQGATYGFRSNNAAAENEACRLHIAVEAENGTAVAYYESGKAMLNKLSGEVSNTNGNAFAVYVKGNAELKECQGNAYSENGGAYGLYISGCAKDESGSFSASGGNVHNGDAYGIYTTAAASFFGKHTKAEAEKDAGYIYGVYNKGTAKLEEVFATACGCVDGNLNSASGVSNSGWLTAERSVFKGDAPGDNSNEENAAGFRNHGCAMLIDCEVFGTLSGASNYNEMYVRGGVYTGYSHGGLYMSHGATGIAYIKDALIRCGHYEGRFTDLFPGDTTEPYAHAYVGGTSGENGSNITAYFDNCQFGDGGPGSDGAIGYLKPSIALRGTSGEDSHTIYLSNCKLGGYGVIRIDKPSMSVYSGVGNTTVRFDSVTGETLFETAGITMYVPDSSFPWADRLFETGELYRKHGPDEKLVGADFYAFKTWLNGKLAPQENG